MRFIIAGKIALDGNEVASMPLSGFDKHVRWKKISMVFQGAMNALDPVYPIKKQMYEILRVHGFAGDYDAKINDSLGSVGLDKSVASYYPHELSGGMKQRVVIAMSLLLEPEVLIADEPTTALDVLVQRDIIELLKKMQREKGISIVIISHDVALVFQIASKTAIMYAGQIVEVGPSVDVCLNPKHPYTRALIAAIPRLTARSKHLQFVSGRPPNLLSPQQGCRFRERCGEAMDICMQDPPEISTPHGYVRCWLYDPSILSVPKEHCQH